MYGWNSDFAFIMKRISISGFFTTFSFIVWNWYVTGCPSAWFSIGGRAIILQKTSSNPLPKFIKPLLFIFNALIYLYQVRRPAAFRHTAFDEGFCS
jgi:hypothetical protein